MALSGTIDHFLTAAQFVDRALGKIGVRGQGFSVSADEQSEAIDTLNEMLKTWSMEGPNLWTKQVQSVALVSGTQTYTLNPRPRLVYNARHVEDGVERLPLSEWDRDVWENFIYKTSTGTPLVYVLDKQRTATTITFWPIPTFDTGTHTVNVGYERAWNIVTAADQEVDVPEEFTETVVMCLAARLIEDYQLPENDHTRRISARAATLFDQAMSYDRTGEITFVRR